MSLARLLSTNAVTIVTPGTDTTRYRHPANDFTDEQTEVSTTGWLTQISTTETVGARDVITTGYKLYLAAGESIAAADRVTVDGLDYEVDGDPHHAQTPRGAHHIECVLRRVTDGRP